MKSKTLFKAFILTTLTTLIAVSQNSLGEQNNSAKQISENTAPKPSQSNTTLKNPNYDEKSSREFKDALITEIKTPANDGAAKPQSSSSSPSLQIKNIRK